jgi:UrcA family protein
MNTSTFRKALILAMANFVGISPLAMGATRAQASAAESHVTVRYGDLSLNVEHDAERLYARLHRAAEKVCNADDVDAVFPEVRAAIYACEQGAIARAVAQVNSPKVTAEFNHRHPTATVG